MNSIKTDKNTLRKWVLLLALLMIPAFAWAQGTKSAKPTPRPVKNPPANNTQPQRTQQQPQNRPPTSPGGNPTYRPGATQSGAYARGNQTAVTRDGRRIEVSYHPNGNRTIATHTNGRTLVSTGPHQGYLERPYLTRNGQTYVQRTYAVNNGTTRAYAYRVSSYRGAVYYRYVPAYHYQPAFYGWAYNPWPAPVQYNWGLNGDPWYAYYGPYFTPSPAYTTASLWLTDYALAENLQAAYRLQNTQPVTVGNPADAAGANATATGNGYASRFTPEVKRELADEVQQQLAAEQAAATNPGQAAPSRSEVPPALASRVFIVSTNLDVTASGRECGLTTGDIITRIGDTPDANQQLPTLVTVSKKADCAEGSQALVSVLQLQEMQNSFAQDIDSGLDTLAAKQGKGGLPVAPDTHTSPGEVPPPAPDVNVQTAVQDLQNAGAQIGPQVQQEAQGNR